MKLLRILIALIIVVSLIIGGALLVKKRNPNISLPFVEKLQPQSQQPKEAEKLQSLLAPTALPIPVKNSKFSITKNSMQEGDVLYTIQGQLLSGVKETAGFYSADFAIDGDSTKTPIKLLLTTKESTFQFGKVNEKKELEWKPEKAEVVFAALKTGQKLELRVVIDRSNADLVKSLEGPVEELYKATQITPTTYSIQPQMIGIL